MMNGWFLWISLCCLTLWSGFAQASEPAKVTIVAPGEAPLQVLSYRPTVGTVEHFEHTIQMESNMMGSDTKMPTIVMLATSEVTHVAPDGSIHSTQTITSATAKEEDGVSAAMVTAVNQNTAQFAGTQSAAIYTPDGHIKSTKWTFAEGTDGETKKSLMNEQSVAIQYPKEAVGVGGKWTVTTPVTKDGIQLTQVATYTVTAIEGNRVDVDLSISQHAEPQMLNTPGVTGGQVELVKLDTTGSGQIKLDLTRINPLHSDLSLTTTTDIKHGTMTMTSKLKMKVVMTAK